MEIYKIDIEEGALKGINFFIYAKGIGYCEDIYEAAKQYIVESFETKSIHEFIKMFENPIEQQYGDDGGFWISPNPYGGRGLDYIIKDDLKEVDDPEDGLIYQTEEEQIMLSNDGKLNIKSCDDDFYIKFRTYDKSVTKDIFDYAVPRMNLSIQKIDDKFKRNNVFSVVIHGIRQLCEFFSYTGTLIYIDEFKSCKASDKMDSDEKDMCDSKINEIIEVLNKLDIDKLNDVLIYLKTL